jgi:transposase
LWYGPGVSRAAATIELSDGQSRELYALARTPSTSNQLAQRARIVLRAAEGATNTEIARELGLSLPTVGMWRAQFAREGVEGLTDRPRSGRPRAIDDDVVNRVIAKTLEPPPKGLSQWTVRELAKVVKLPPTTVHRIWRTHQLKPHQVRTFKYSTDPELEAKVIDIVGLYLDPPANALVLCVDEKTQIQALDRTQPTLPLKRGKAERRTHDYRRHGTTSLYAALEIATGKVVGQTHPRHRHQEFLAFLRRIDREFPGGDLHLVLDNSSTHSTPEVKSWLAEHPRVVFHFTPTGASWMNLVESWFSILTRKQVRRGTYTSVVDLVRAIRSFIAAYNRNPTPFVWTKSPQQILAKAVRQDTSETEH